MAHTTLAAPVSMWATLLVLAATQFWLGAYFANRDALPIDVWLGWLFLILGCSSTAQAWELGTRRVELMPDAVIAVRGLRRRSIAWQDIQAIGRRRRRWLGGQAVVITPRVGKPVIALVPGSWLNRTFERDHGRLVQEWRRRVGEPASR